MLLRHRGMLTLLTLVVLASVTVAGGTWLHTSRVDPATASRGQVMRYLVLADLSAQPLEVQQAWVNRLQQELTSDFAPQGEAKGLSAGYREQLLRNIGTLQAVWFRTRTAEYAQLPAAEREAFMLDQLAVVGSWAKVASLLEAAPVPVSVATRAMIERIDHWVGEASGPEREQMIAAVKDGTLCWLSTTDLSKQPLEMKTGLAERIARDLEGGARPQVASLVTDEARQAQLKKNAAELVEAYIYKLAENYAEIAKSERTKFIDEQLAAVQRWGIEDLLAKQGAASTSRAAAALVLIEQSQLWIEHAPPERRPQVQTLVSAVQQRLVWKQLPAWMRR